MTARRSRAAPWAVAGALALAVLWAWRHYDVGTLLTLDQLKASRDALQARVQGQPLATAAAFFALYVAATALSIPGAVILTLAAGAMFGLGWGFFDCNNMPILCQVARPELRSTGYGIMNLVSISCGGLADWVFGIMRDHQVPLHTIFGTFASVALVSVALVLMIKPRNNLESST